ncbi:uncharacterized protein LOC107829414 [Nicotiana tabacum]|uniref:Uncharacterized protein LOC107829414 n=1 Tax=Nicotiana tabacum TaxID=4097 RepID=A0A1S4DG86_TOBAC|nr:PREDICTED: uncharacterized protein LOC107829414 [Nicotiana tabacum]
MGKIWIEVCLISARGLRRTSSLWKLQWYAVGWIDPNNKYCSKIDSSGNANPVWKTKFSMFVDTSELDTLHVEVYSREPIFLREKLLGTATVILKEFLDKYNNNTEVSKPIEEVGSFQLRRKNSNKPQGFVDVSIRISEEREEPSSLPGDNEGFKLADNSSGFNLANGYKPATAYPQPQSLTPSQLQRNQPQLNHQYARQVPYATNYSHPLVGGMSYTPAAGSSYQPPRAPPPPPPANVGYIPTFLPRTDNASSSYLSMPQSGAAATRNARPGFGMGVGAGALAAGAVIFGEDFMSGFDIPRGLPDPSLTISLDPPF